ncbi:syntaxin-32-like isoform X2 [Actinidia eriantha]|uniref:syntaxin-32-like isoform X2 n=1 Tax=Actinidia eriantha TaxID=165200 RepID=UPI0025882B67|nr:syntaxin-32-like isoform X2 [Actinidia eriantha]
MPVKPANSSFRDRTQEFLGVAERLKKSFSSAQNGPSSRNSKPEDQRAVVAMQSEFNKRASKVGFGIHQTSQKLAKLAKLAKRTSVFDDPTMEIQELTAVIKQDITALNSAVVDLQLLCNSRNESGDISSDTSSHSTTVVDDLKNRLMSATKAFKEVLTMRTENLKVHENRRQLFSSTASKETTNPFVRQRPLATRSAVSSSAGPPPWVNKSPSSSQSFPRWMGRFSHCCSNSINNSNSNSSWFLYKTVTRRVELKLFRTWSQPFMSWVASSTSWQPWCLNKEKLPSGLTKTWKTHWQTLRGRKGLCLNISTAYLPIGG